MSKVSTADFSRRKPMDSNLILVSFEYKNKTTFEQKDTFIMQLIIIIILKNSLTTGRTIGIPCAVNL